VRRGRRGVVVRAGEPRLVRRERVLADLVLEDEAGIVGADEDAVRVRDYGDHVLRHSPVIVAALLTLAGAVEVLRAPDGRLVSALALPAVTLPVAWCRSAPLPALWVVTVALALQAVAGGSLAGSAVTTVVVLAVLLYCAARDAEGRSALAGAAGAAVAVAVTRIAFDPAARPAREAVMTFAAVATPLVVGRWASGQRLLQRELADRAARRARDRASDAQHAAEEERARIATDLQSAIAGGLRTIAVEAATLRDDLRAGESGAARERLNGIATTARAALADVRRVLGVLRHDGEPRRLTPPRPAAPAATPAGEAPPDDSAPHEGGQTPQHSFWLYAAVRIVKGSDPLTIGVARVVDGALAFAVAAVVAVEVGLAASGLAALTALPIAVPLLWRRRAPVLAALGVLGGIALQSAVLDLDMFPLGDMLAMVAASYAIGAHAARAAGIVVLAAGAAAHAALVYPDGVVAALLGGVGLPWAVGRVVRGNRALTRAGRRRNAEIEERRRREALAAVTRERVRVARELHDAVAHNVSVIAIQAGGAEGIVDRDPVRAGEVVALIAAVASEALDELGRLTGLPATDPGSAPSLSRVDDLAGRARAGGLAVTLEVDGCPPVLSAGIDLAAFRIVQEALANAGKHARARRAWVTVRYAPHTIELEIADDGRGPDGRARGGGHGLIGMRERVALYGGSIEIGARAPTGYRVKARLPL
jgi:signal transduction histidine kinase